MACEGESTEPDYLRYLSEQFGDGDRQGGRPFWIQPVYRKNGMTHSEAVEAVEKAAAEDEAWALFDRDQHHDIPQAVKPRPSPGSNSRSRTRHSTCGCCCTSRRSGEPRAAVTHARSLVASCAHGRCKPGHAKTEPVGRDAEPQTAQQWMARSGHAPDCQVLQRDPSTDMWRLLVALGIHTDEG
ncbi:MAG TPA: RloB domain-containing protein [Nonomuraea sp.]|nr:RloB domain-containing protein [Nonomuraea sp.]